MLTEVWLAAFHRMEKTHKPPTGLEPLSKSGASTSPPKDGLYTTAATLRHAFRQRHNLVAADVTPASEGLQTWEFVEMTGIVRWKPLRTPSLTVC